MPIFQMRNLREKEIKHWAQHHTEVNTEDGVEPWDSGLKIHPPKHYVCRKREHIGLKMNSYPGRAREQVLAGRFIKCWESVVVWGQEIIYMRQKEVGTWGLQQVLNKNSWSQMRKKN